MSQNQTDANAFPLNLDRPVPNRPVPDKLVVLTFDDGVKSQLTVVAPLLQHYGFGATFYITEGLRFLAVDKVDGRGGRHSQSVGYLEQLNLAGSDPDRA